MSTTDLGACEWFVWDLRRSNLIDRGQLDQVVGEFLKRRPQAEPPELAQYLVNENILSQFQAERLLQGKTQGLVLGPYTLMDALGSGSMGTVYKALNKNDNKWYAVKVLPRRSMWNVRIARRQVRSFEQCKHPAVVPFVDVGTAGGTHYLAWPLVEGTPLDTLLQKKGGRLDPGEAALYAFQTAEGLDICHQNGMIHGLVKPSNLMVGSDNQVRILDFGIGTLLAESEGESLVDTMSTANTLTSGLDCGSPESILEPTNRTPAGDQYSLGCTLYYLLTGRYPFPEGTAVEKMMAHQMKQPPSIKEFNPEVPDELIDVVDRLMQKSPEARYPKTSDVVEALRPLAEATGVSARSALAASASRLAPRAVAAATATPSAFGENGFGGNSSFPRTPSASPSALSTPDDDFAALDDLPAAAPSRPSAAPSRPVMPAKSAPTPSAPKPSIAPQTKQAPPPSIPTRDSIRRQAAQQAAAADDDEVPTRKSRSRDSSEGGESASLEDRLGSTGVVLLAVLAAAVAWFLMSFLMN